MIDDSEVERAVEIFRAGGLVAFATETVYGLGADATNAAAVAKIFAAKGRPGTNPLIVHVADISIARRYVTSWPETAERLARDFWPGSLTFVLPKVESIVPAVTAGLPTVAVRCPNHPLALELLRKFDGPIAAPSANRSNRISPTTAEHVRQELGNAVDLILDGGACTVGIESTVIDLSTKEPAILRPGTVTRQQIEKLMGPVKVGHASTDHSAPAVSPGQHPVHYAPDAPALRFNEGDLDNVRKISSRAGGRPAIFLLIHETDLAARVRAWQHGGMIIEMPGSADQYARRLYAALREADDLHPSMILVQEPPIEAPWDAVTDRVRRATRPASDAS